MSDQYNILAASQLDLGMAVFLAEAAQAAYLVAPEQWAKASGFTRIQAFDRGNIQGFWCAAGDVALLSFRGTSNPAQWLRDARFFPVPHPWGRVHVGFIDGIANVETDLAQFDPIACGAKHLWITGHSLGGALALIAAARLKMKGFSASIYTYGQPRVGLGEFADRFAIELPGRLYRFVNQSDIVTRVPPGLLYQHTGIVKRIVRPGVLESVPGVAAPTNAIQDAVNRVAGTTILESVRAISASGIVQPVLIDADIAPLSEQQFAELQLALGAGAPASHLEGVMLEGVLPWFSDHAISEYVRLLKEIRDLSK